MTSKALADVIEQAEQLSAEEQLKLIAHLASRSLTASSVVRPRRRWSEIKGAAPYPLVGEDAQEWVSRTRAEGDAARERQWFAGAVKVGDALSGVMRIFLDTAPVIYFT